MSRRIIISILCLSVLFAVASSASEVEVMGGLKLVGGALIFPDGTSQNTAPQVFTDDTYLNTATGTDALYSNTTGYDNTATGPYALYENTTGYRNTATGLLALNWNSTGYENTADGAYALLYNTTGYHNTAIGSWALFSNTTASDNVAAGYRALYYDTTGDINVAAGYQALYYNTTGNGNTAIGPQALCFNSIGDYNTAIGNVALFENSTGHHNIAIGSAALYHNSTGHHNTAIGAGADVIADSNWVNATVIGANAIGCGDNCVRIGDNYVTRIGGQVAWSNLSDVREKKDIQNISLGLDFIKSLRPVEFRMKQGNDRTDFGFIAQDIETLLGTGYNILGIGGDEARTLSLRYTDFIAPMIKAMQEQQQIIDNLNDEIARQNETIQRVQKELDELKTLILSMANR